MTQDLDLKPQRHIPALDGVRGVAILMVLGVHFLYTGAFPSAPPAYLHVFHLLQFGWMGVDLFFVLSGFLITGILLDTRASSNFFRSFYLRRALRIFPLYYLVVVAVLLTIPWQRHFPWLLPGIPEPSTRLSFILYLNNWVVPLSSLTGGSLSLFWSLAVEEQFYLLWPSVVFRLSRPTLTRLCLAICLVLPFLRLALESWNHFFVFENTLTRMDSLVWGALAALLVRSPAHWLRLRPTLPWIAAACAALVLIIDFPLHDFYTRTYYTQSIGFSLIALGFAASMLVAYHSDSTHGPLARVLRFPLLTSFGRYSYGIYVFHGFVLEILMHRVAQAAWFGRSLPGAILLYLAFNALCYTTAAISFNLYEKQFLRLKTHFAPRFRNPATRPSSTLDRSAEGRPGKPRHR